MKAVLLTCVLAMSLAGCAIIRKPAPTEPGVADAGAWQQHRQQMQAFRTWSLQGRVATGQLLGWTGNLSWRQKDAHFDVRLSGPLGAGGFTADGTLDRVLINTGKRKLVTTEPDALVEKTLGWTFPLEPLRYWARGIPAPGDYQRISVNDAGRLTALTQQGWTLAFPDYTQPHGAPTVPRRIVLDNGETRIRLVVDRWFGYDGAKSGN